MMQARWPLFPALVLLLLPSAMWSQNSFTITVTSGANKIEKANVTLTQGNTDVSKGTTDVNGQTTLSAPDGKYVLTVEADGYNRYTGNRTVSGASINAPTIDLVSSSQGAGADKSTQGPSLKDLGFGVGLALRWNIIGPQMVNDATVDPNGFVRVNTRSNTTAGLVLEMHYFAYNPGPQNLKHAWCGHCGIGPFVGVESGDTQVISAVGGGLMVGWKVHPQDVKSRAGFGLGLGYAAIPSAKTLGDEFVDGQLAPKGPDGKVLPIRYENRDKGSLLFMLAFTF